MATNDADMQTMTITEARKHCEYMANKGKQKKGRQQNKVEKNIWDYRTSSTMAPLTEEGKANYEKIFGHK